MAILICTSFVIQHVITSHQVYCDGLKTWTKKGLEEDSRAKVSINEAMLCHKTRKYVKCARKIWPCFEEHARD